ncbi:hypothetical protein QTN25_000386 [Entamoeba marina]
MSKQSVRPRFANVKFHLLNSELELDNTYPPIKGGSSFNVKSLSDLRGQTDTPLIQTPIKNDSSIQRQQTIKLEDYNAHGMFEETPNNNPSQDIAAQKSREEIIKEHQDLVEDRIRVLSEQELNKTTKDSEDIPSVECPTHDGRVLECFSKEAEIKEYEELECFHTSSPETETPTYSGGELEYFIKYPEETKYFPGYKRSTKDKLFMIPFEQHDDDFDIRMEMTYPKDLLGAQQRFKFTLDSLRAMLETQEKDLLEMVNNVKVEERQELERIIENIKRIKASVQIN